MNTEAVIWTWIYTGMIVGAFSLVVVIWALLYDHNNKD